MNERGWFTFLVRGTGLALLAYALISAAPILVMLLYRFLEPFSPLLAGMRAVGQSDWEWIAWYGSGPVAAACAGIYLIRGGTWLIDRFCREVVDRCKRCGYDLSGNPAGACPECSARPADGERAERDPERTT